MARKKRTPEENARREKIRELLQLANIGSMDDIQGLFVVTVNSGEVRKIRNNCGFLTTEGQVD